MSAEGRSEKQFASMIKKLYANGAYSDLTIVCGTYTYDVHKAIICPQSPFFEAACRPDTFVEGKTGVVNIPASSGRPDAFYAQRFRVDDFDWDLDVETTRSVELMIHYFYHHDYDTEDLYPDRGGFLLFNPRIRKGVLSEHARIYAMGEKYDVPGLKAVALSEFRMSSCMAYQHGGLPTAMVIAFNSTPETDKGLRAAVLDLLHDCGHKYNKQEEVQQIISSIPELAYGLYLKLLECDIIGRRVEITRKG